MARGSISRRADSGLGGRLVEGFAQQLGGQVERESGSQGTTVRLILPSREDWVQPAASKASLDDDVSPPSPMAKDDRDEFPGRRAGRLAETLFRRTMVY